MGESKVDRTRERLVDAISLYRLQPTRMTALLAEGATDALVAGWDSPALRRLAGSASGDNLWELDALVDDVTAELDLTSAFVGKDIEVQAAAAMCRRATRGEMDARDLARWAHQVIGHGGAQELQPLVELDDHYDIADIGPMSLTQVDELAHQTIARLAAAD